MADPLSIAASIAGLISLSVTIVGTLRDVSTSNVDAPISMKRVIAEVDGMKLIFCQIQLLIGKIRNQPDTQLLVMGSINDLAKLLMDCNEAYSVLLGYLGGINRGLTGTIKNIQPKKGKGRLGNIKWVLWIEAKIMVLVEDLQRHKTSLGLMLQIIRCFTEFESKAMLEGINDQISESSQHHQQMLAEIQEAKQQIQQMMLEFRESQTNETHSTVEMNQERISSQMSAPGTPSPAAGSYDDTTPSSSKEAMALARSRKQAQQDENENFLLQLENSGVYINRTKARKTISDICSVFTAESRYTGRWSELNYISVSKISVVNLPILIRGLLESKGQESKEIPDAIGKPLQVPEERPPRITNISNKNIIRTVLASVDVGKERSRFECMAGNKGNELRWTCSLLLIHNRAQFEWKNRKWGDVAKRIASALRSCPEPKFFEPETAKLTLQHFSTNVILHRNYFDRNAKLPPLTANSKMKITNEFVEAVMGCHHRIPGVFHEFEDRSFPLELFPNGGISGKHYATNVKLHAGPEGMLRAVKYENLSRIGVFMWTKNVIELVLEFHETKSDLEITVVCPETHFMEISRGWEKNDLGPQSG
ncbi:hypothetical protein DFH27DRAFT_524939 [Peziza echinospora]|nr:hypothetical protein DFH27DRAFT_524939 [Peziza echinospora]